MQNKNILIGLTVLLFAILLSSIAFAAVSDGATANANALKKIHPLLSVEISKAKAESARAGQIVPIGVGRQVPALGTAKKVKVLLTVNKKEKLDAVAGKVLGKAGNIKAKFALGKTIVAEIPADKIEEIAEGNEIVAVWPDREVKADLLQGVPQVNAQIAWNSGFMGEGIKVAVVDTGIDESHELLRNKVVASANFSDSQTTSDLFGHGTHVAGIIAGNGTILGIAPEAVLLNAKVLNDSGAGSLSSVIAGINWAVEQGAQVINLSLGGAYSDINSPLNMAISDAVALGVVVVVSAGNCGQCGSSACGGYSGITTPGNSPEAITVGAVDAQNLHACFSSGENISGVGIKPDIVAPGVGILSSVPNGFAKKTGTSMAAPFVSGAAAIVLGAYPMLLPAQIKQFLEEKSTDLGVQGKDVDFGFGLLNLADLNVAGFDTNNTDQNNTNWRDENVLFDVNGMQFAFSLVAPEALEKNQEGSFSMKKLAASGLAAQSGEEFTDTIVEFVIKDKFGFIVSREFVGPKELSPASNESFDLQWSSTDVGTYSIEASVFESGIQADALKNAELNATAIEKTFRVIVPNIVSIEEFNAPETAGIGTSQGFSVQAKNSGSINLNGFFEIQFVDALGNTLDIASSESRDLNAGKTTEFLLEKTIIVPDGNYSTKAILHFEDQNIEATKNIAITMPRIASISFLSVPASVPVDQNIAVQLRVSNNGTISIAPVVLLDVFDENELKYSILLGGEEIRAQQSKDFAASFPAKLAAGKTFLLVATIKYNSNTETKTTSFFVFDAARPIVLATKFAASTTRANYTFVELAVRDSSKIASASIWVRKPNGFAFTKQMRLLQENDSNTVFGYAIEQDFPGYYFFIATVCDAFNNCQSTPRYYYYARTMPYNCTGKNVLAIIDDDAFSLGNYSNTNCSVVQAREFSDSDASLSFGLHFNDNNASQSGKNPVERNYSIASQYSQGLIQNAVYFNGNSGLDYANENQSDLNISHGTVSFWFQRDPIANITSYETYLRTSVCGVSANSLTVYKYYNQQNSLQFSVSPCLPAAQGGCQEQIICGSENAWNAVDNKWHNITLTWDLNHVFDGNTCQLWVDGNSIDTKTTIVTQYYSPATVLPESDYTYSDNRLEIGGGCLNGGGTNFIKGKMDEFQVFKQPLNARQIKEIYAKGTSTENCTRTDNNTTTDEFAWTQKIKELGYCTTAWKTSQNGSPSLAFLKAFDAVVWATGNRFGYGIDANDANLLQPFIASGGKLFLEGSDIASEHALDGFMENVAHASFEEEKNNNETIALTQKSHPLTANLGNVSLDSAKAPFADAIMPANNAVSILGFAEGESIIVAAEDANQNYSRTIFASFALNALDENSQNTLVSNALYWLTQPQAPILNCPTQEIPKNHGFEWQAKNLSSIFLQIGFDANFLPGTFTQQYATKSPTIASSYYLAYYNNRAQNGQLYARLTGMNKNYKRVYSTVCAFKTIQPLLPTIIAPENNATITKTTVFNWNKNDYTYALVQVSKDSNFAFPVSIGSWLSTNNTTLERYWPTIQSLSLADNDKILYWRLLAWKNGQYAYTTPKAFTIASQ